MEHTSGKLTKGEYKVKLPDGRVQVVSYEADHYGFRPRVTYEGIAVPGRENNLIFFSRDSDLTIPISVPLLVCNQFVKLVQSSMKVIHDSPCQPDHDCKPFSACLVLRSKEDERGPPKMKETWKVPISLSTLFFLKLPSVHVLIHFSRLVIRSVGRKYRLWWAGQLLGTSQLLSAKIENGRIALYLGEVLNIYLQLCTLGETGTDNLEMFGPYIIFL